MINSKRELIKELREISETMHMDKAEFCNKYGEIEDHYYPFMVGYIRQWIDDILKETE